MIDLTGKTLFMTGANGGIPRAIAQVFLDCGANLALSDLDGEALRAFAAELDPTGARVATTTCDVTDSAAVVAAAAAAADTFGAIDFVVPAAGLFPGLDVAGMSDADWKRVTGINLDGVFFTIRSAIPHMNDGGAIVTIASLAAHRGSKDHAHYAASKGAVLSLTRSLMYELAPRQIRCNAVSPGLIDTVMVQPLMEARGDALMAATPQGRLGTPREVATVVAFLCSDWASFVNGQTISVNGGIHTAA